MNTNFGTVGLLLAALTVFQTAAGETIPPMGSIENSQAAQAYLRIAAKHLGGEEQLMTGGSLEIDFSGDSHNWFQGVAPGEALSFRYHWRQYVDWNEELLMLEQHGIHSNFEV